MSGEHRGDSKCKSILVLCQGAVREQKELERIGPVNEGQGSSVLDDFT